jgi:hypothetical protein
MSPPPERPCDDVGGLNSFLRETLGYAADFLDRPTDEVGCLGVAFDFVFLGVFRNQQNAPAKNYNRNARLIVVVQKLCSLKLFHES